MYCRLPARGQGEKGAKECLQGQELDWQEVKELDVSWEEEKEVDLSWQEEDVEEELVKLEDKEREGAGTWKEWKKEEDQTVPSDAEWEQEEEQEQEKELKQEKEQEQEQVVPSCPTFSCQTVRLEELVFVATLGVGGFGRVELVTAGPDNTPFALKKLKKTQVEGRL